MFAVVVTGGKQYRVSKDDTIVVEKLDAQKGDKVTLDKVLMIGDDKSTKIGTPVVDGAVVKAEVIDQSRAEKVLIFKKKRRKNHRRLNGHRQHLTTLKVTEVKA